MAIKLGSYVRTPDGQEGWVIRMNVAGTVCATVGLGRGAQLNDVLVAELTELEGPPLPEVGDRVRLLHYAHEVIAVNPEDDPPTITLLGPSATTPPAVDEGITRRTLPWYRAHLDG